VILRARAHEWTFPRERPLLMGILNTTPDSVSDSERLDTVERRVAYGRALAGAGADVVDVGGESGRTDRPPVSVAEEIARVEPTVRALAAAGIAVGIDTFRAEVAEAAVAAGASLINDVAGLADPAMARLAARTGAGLVVMHTRADPKTAAFPGYDDPLADVAAFLEERVRLAQAEGVAPEQLVVDPGLDYAKTPEESIAVLRRLGELRALQRPILLAVSRKYFVGMVTGRRPDERLAGTLAALAHGVEQGAAIVRVHDVRAAVDYLAVRAALLAEGAPALAGDPADESLKWL
jgi:dihydropteroate synthase